MSYQGTVGIDETTKRIKYTPTTGNTTSQQALDLYIQVLKEKNSKETAKRVDVYNTLHLKEPKRLTIRQVVLHVMLEEPNFSLEECDKMQLVLRCNAYARRRLNPSSVMRERRYILENNKI